MKQYPSKSEIKHTLQGVWPNECQVIGNELLDMIADGETDFEYDEGGSHLDLTTVIDVLGLSVEIIAIGISLYEIGSKLQGERKDTIQELFKEFLSNEYQSISTDKRDHLLKESLRLAKQERNIPDD